MKKITILNQKGGAGKTSFSVLVTMALASKGYRVLAVDCDPQGGLTSFLDPTFDDRSGVYDLLVENNLNVIHVDRQGVSFDFLPADHRLDKIYATMDNFAFKRVLNDLDYDYIVFDTPPTVQGITRAAAFISDKIFIPADISRSTVKPTLYTIESLKEIEKKGKVVFIGFKEPKAESKTFLAELSREFISVVGKNYGGTIPRNATMQKAIADNIQKWTEKRKEKILNPILEMVGEN